ncbi:probable S-adenosylmethionine-dependent methyltransferase At5g38100 [Mizuhopecten yessoensis]|uniref:S-adenosylmethionine-dependent methyltransferase At5g38100 n=1 Tax=Mizuhopecten yessoensis TaxID=6573 RepID=A0A210QG52_MIZYE|nr:probable S-adenosylmethionine-dependent methyltransferase At5g38100 [Mizuhopecten yessoensis]OWF47743.1 S-adenosylmethionine-dependent methyltransferase At5g38100 [Mizuhopecten yessoensis]
MKMMTMPNKDVDDMYSVHGHAGNLCRASIMEGLEKILKLRSSYQADQPICIADFGTADGKASLSLVKEVIDIVQTDLGQEQTIVVYYNDQPMNDFNLLSKVIQGDRQDSGLSGCSNVYPVIVPRTMYKQCLPDNSLDLAMSAVATHYLSKQVCRIANGVFMGEADNNEQRLMREQGKTDWRAFVIARGRELKPGGFLVSLNASLNDDNDETSHVDKGNHNLGKFVSDMARDGVITQEEYLATNFHSHYTRTAADFQEPFSSTLPEVDKLGLELVSVKSMKHYLQHPLFDIVEKDETEKMEYSRKVVASVFPWFHHVIRGGLSFSRTEDEKQMIVEQYFNRLQAYAFAHSDHKPYLIFTEVVIQKCI